MHKATHRRLEALEAQRGAAAPFVFVTFGLDDDGLYHAQGGQTYTAEEYAELARAHNVILIEYVSDWPPA